LASAAAWVTYNRNAPDYALEAQPWDPSIKALAHSPSVLIWMNNNQEWARTIGTAFTYQPSDVMESIQRLRSEALAAGTLVNTPQQVVVYQDNRLCIEPATPDVVYVPVYDWRTVYVRGYRHEPITFFTGFNVGSWFNFDFDWDRHSVVVGADWRHGWDHRWDHDNNARQVNVHLDFDRDHRDDHDNDRNHIDNDRDHRDNRDVRDNNNRDNNAKVVHIGGRDWTRDANKNAPRLPDNVKPGRPNDRGRPGGTRADAVPQRQVVVPAHEPDRQDRPAAQSGHDAGGDHQPAGNARGRGDRSDNDHDRQ